MRITYATTMGYSIRFHEQEGAVDAGAPQQILILLKHTADE
jgi:hypothetical protein